MPDADSELQSLGALLAEQCADHTEHLVEQFGLRITELPHDPVLTALLQGSTGANLETLAHLLRGHVPMSDIQAPAAAVEYARRLAQRGTSPSALLRAYRLGQALILEWAGAQISARISDPLLGLQTMQLLTQTSFAYVDAVAEEVIVAYQDERERWLANRSAVQRETIEALLRDERLDLTATETTLGYRLRQHHLGLVLWTSGTDAGLADSEAVLVQIARRVCGSRHPLFVPRDRETAWAWLPAGRSGQLDLESLADEVAAVVRESGKPVNVAIGTPEAGEPGFRASHLDAAAAHAVALLGAHADGTVISYGDPTVRAAALLARDLPSTRRMVTQTLGELGADNDSAARMRETVLAFIQGRESYVATAARMHLHKNTVKYRVDRAVETRGKPLGEERLDLELALIACRWLGPEVLVAG